MATLEFSPAELRTLGMALRIAARQAQTDAASQGNPRIQQLFAADAESYAALANKVEAARSQ